MKIRGFRWGTCLAIAAALTTTVAYGAVNVLQVEGGGDQYAPARQLIDEGVAVALATDFNPGSSFTPSMPMVIALACRALHITPAEAIMAATINAAHAVKRGRQTGSLEVGKQADVIICDIPDHRWLGYSFGWNPVEITIAGGAIV